MKVLFTHLWDERNKGDAAIMQMQVLLVRGMRPHAELRGLSVFGHSDARLATAHRWCEAQGMRVFPAVFGSPAAMRLDRPPIQGLEKLGNFVGSFLQGCVLLVASAMRSIETVQCFARRHVEAVQAIRDADIVMSKGGAYYFSLPGLRGIAYVARTCWVVWLALLWGRQVVILPHSFGPLEGRIGRWLLRITLSRCTRIMCREGKSQEALVELGVPVAITCRVPDLAFAVALPNIAKANHVRCSYGLNKKPQMGRLLVTARPCGGFKDAGVTEAYLSQLVKLLVSYLQEGWDIVLVPQVNGPEAREDDREALRYIWKEVQYRGLGQRLLFIDNDLSVDELMAIYASGDLLIGTRMHSVILAAIVGTPAVAISYLGPKHMGIMKWLGLEDFCLGVDGFEAVVARLHVDRLLSIRDQVSAEILSRVSEYKKEIYCQMAALVEGL